MKLSLIFLFTLGSLASSRNRGQSTPVAAPIPACDLKGRVLDKTGRPIPQVKIIIQGEKFKHETLTDDDGNYLFLQLREKSTFNMSVVKDGYVPIPDRSISVDCSHLTGSFRVKNHLNFCGTHCGEILKKFDQCESMSSIPDRQTAQISGYVYNNDASPMPGAVVKAKLLGAGSHAAETDDKGFFHMENLLPGAYEVTASDDPYRTVTKASRTLNAGDNCKLLFVLVPRSESLWLDH